MEVERGKDVLSFVGLAPFGPGVEVLLVGIVVDSMDSDAENVVSSAEFCGERDWHIDDFWISFLAETVEEVWDLCEVGESVACVWTVVDEEHDDCLVQVEIADGWGREFFVGSDDGGFGVGVVFDEVGDGFKDCGLVEDRKSVV